MNFEQKTALIIFSGLFILGFYKTWIYDWQPAARECKDKGGQYQTFEPHCIKKVIEIIK